MKKPLTAVRELPDVREESAERIAKQLKELEQKRDAIMESLQEECQT